jgi:hypothetical protein
LWRYLLPSLAFVVLILVSGVAYASPNLIADGSFETPTNGLDNVVLTGAAGPALPEPATLGLFGLGLVGVPLCRRRRPS